MSEPKLGQVLNGDEGRDAVHVAIICVKAAEKLWPGLDVGLVNGEATTNTKNKLGLVDPYLQHIVKPGQYFYLWLYPNTVTGMRHHWEHPAFPHTVDETVDAKSLKRLISQQDASERWIQEFADNIGVSYDDLMAAAREYINNEECYYDNSEKYKDYWNQFEDFWRHYALVTGTNVDHIDGDVFFSCSC